MAKKIDLKRIKGFIYEKFEIIIFFILALFIINSFGGWNYLHQNDNLFMLNPEKYLHDVLYFWKDGYSFGFGLPEFGLIPFYAFQVVLIKTSSLFIDLWKSLILSQMIMYYFTVFLSLLFGYLFFKEFFKVFFDKKDLQLKGRLLLTLVTFFYVINPHTITWIFWRYTTWSLFWVGLPLLGYLYLKYLKCNEKSKGLRYILYLGAIFITPIAAGFPQVGLLFLYLLFFILTVLYYLKTNKKLCYLVKKSIFFILIFSLLISWILIPQFTFLRMASEYALAFTTESDRVLLDYASQFTTILNSLRLIGKWEFHSTYEDRFPYSWADSYLSNKFVNILLFLYPVIILLSLFLLCKEKDSRIKKVYSVINIILLSLPLLMKGASEPFKNMGYLLLNIHTVFFRHPYDRFIHLYVVLLSFDFLYLLYKLYSIKEYKKLLVFVVLFLFASFSILNYPYFTGELVHPSDRVRIPESYLNLPSQTSKTFNCSEVRLLVIPFSIAGEYSYNFSGKVNHVVMKPALTYNFLDNISILQIPYSYSERRVLEYLSKLIYSDKYREFVNFSGSIGINYIIVYKDYSEKYMVSSEIKDLARQAIKFVDNLERIKLIKKVFENGNIAVYHLNAKDNLFITEGKPLIMLGDLSILPSLDFIRLLKDISPFSLSPNTYHFINVTDNILVKESTPVNEFIANLKQMSSYIHRENTVFTSSKKVPTSCTPTKKDLLTEYSFENVLNNWDFPEKGWLIFLDNDSYSGKSSLKATTNISKNWSWIRGPEINVTPENVYMIITHMKYENVKQSHIKIEGYFESKNEWRPLRQIPWGQDGTSDWKEYKGTIEIPPDVTKIKIVLNAGWVEDKSKGNTTTWFDNIAVYNITKYCNPVQTSTTFNIERQDTYKLFIRYFKNQEGCEIKVYLDGKPIQIKTKDQLNKFVWKDLGTYHLEKGKHTLILENVKGFNAVNLFTLIPEKKYEKSKQEISKILQNKTIIYLFEAESDMYRDNANITKKFGGEASNGEVLEIANGKAWQEIEIIKKGTYRLAIRAKGDFKVKIGDKKFEYHNSNLTYWYSPVFELNEGKYNLTITPLNNPAANFSFESVSPNINIENGIIKKLPEGVVSFSNDSYSGNSSLKITTNLSEKGWLWFRTIDVNVMPGERYLAITHMKYENVVASYISMEGYNETSGEWIELGEIPSGQTGTSDWKEYKQILTIPEDITKIGFVLNAGWIEDLSEGNAATWFDDIRIYPVKDYLDVIWLYSTKNNETLNELFKTNETPAEVINYTKINPTKYEVKVNASKPFMLSFAEAYDPLWVARVYKADKKIGVVKSIPLYSVINGFWIGEPGNLKIEIRYKPQDWFELGLGISVTTFIGCISYLFYDWRRGEGDKWALRIGARVHNAGSVVSRRFGEGVQRLKKKPRRKK